MGTTCGSVPARTFLFSWKEHVVASECEMFLREHFLHTNSLTCTANLIALEYEADYAAG